MSVSNLLLHSRKAGSGSDVLLEVSPQKAGWEILHFSVRRLTAGQLWSDRTADHEVCLVLLAGKCRVKWSGDEVVMGPRLNVFESYPYACYLPPGVDFEVLADQNTELADGRAPARKEFPARLIRPQDCGYEIRGGGNATRQIVDIMPPEFPADRLLVCEVYTPSGNWSSYPPHKHDTDNPPGEVKLEEVYYYRFQESEAFGIQRVYSSGHTFDETMMVRDGDLVLIREGYHPFVTAYGHNAYYLNFLAGERRSMAASDDPQYARFRKDWPKPDSRLPVLEKPSANGSSSSN